MITTSKLSVVVSKLNCSACKTSGCNSSLHTTVGEACSSRETNGTPKKRKKRLASTPTSTLTLLISPSLQPPLNTRFFSLLPVLIIAVSLHTLRQIFLKLRNCSPFLIIYLHIFVCVMGILIIFAVVEVFHQPCRRIANLQGNGIVASLLHIFLHTAICYI